VVLNDLKAWKMDGGIYNREASASFRGLMNVVCRAHLHFGVVGEVESSSSPGAAM
jgi:hypothetical protein